MKVDPFIEAEKVAGHNVNKACGLLEVSRAAYYQRRNGPPSARQATDAELLEHITAIHTESKGTYGSPRIHRELGHRQVACGRRRVTRLMRQAGLEGRCKKRWRKTTVPDPDAQAARDLIGRYFARGEDIDRRYVGDITYIGTWEGWAYLATVIDLASRRVVGWALADHMRTELVQDALKMAFAHRAPEKGVVFHSDRGCQPGLKRSSQHLDDGGVLGWELAGNKRRRGRCETRCIRPGGRRAGSAIRFRGSGSRSPKGVASEQAAISVGVASAVGTRWFREAGGMRPISLAPLSGRYLSFAEREEIAILKAQGLRRSRDRPTDKPVAVDDQPRAAPQCRHPD